MLEVRVYHKDTKDFSTYMPNDRYGSNIDTILNNIDLCNYLTFDGIGVNLIDENLKFYENGDYMGYVCAPSDSNCDCDDSTYIAIGTTIDLDAYPQRVSICFKDICCAEIEVSYTNTRGLPIHVEKIPIDSNIVTIELSRGYFTAQIKFKKSVFPNQSIRIASFVYGVINTFNKFTQHNLIEEINVLSDDLPINQFEASIVNPEPDNITFAKKDPLVIFSNGKYYGHFYIVDVQRSARNIFDIMAQNSISLFENDFTTWKTNAYGELAVSTVLNNLKTFTGVDIEYDLDANDKLIRGHHKDGTCRAALCEVCFGLGKMVDGSRNDKIVLRPVPTQITSVITNKDRRIIGDALFKRSNIISSAVVSYKELYPTDAIESDFTQKTISGKVGDIVTISFDKPTAVITNNGVYSTYSKGFEIIYETLCKYTVRLTATSGSVVYIERPMSDEFQTVIENENAQIENVKKYNTFLTRIYDVYEQRNANIKKYIKSRGKVSAKIRLRNERVGDLIQIETAWDGIITGIITKMETIFGYEDIANIEVLEWNL